MTILPNVRDLSVGCFWKDPGQFFMKIQKNTVKNCTISLNLASRDINCKITQIATCNHRTYMPETK